MNRLLYFLGGLAVGGLSGFLVGRKLKKKKNDEEAKTPDTTEDFDDSKNEDGSVDLTDYRGEGVTELLMREHYIPDRSDYEEVVDEYDEEDLQNDIEEVDDYLCQYEHPEDDLPRMKTFEPITNDEYYTERNDWDKIKLFMDSTGSSLCDALGNDYLEMFSENGYGSGELAGMSVRAEDGILYFRNELMQTDYMIIFEEDGEDG